MTRLILLGIVAVLGAGVVARQVPAPAETAQAVAAAEREFARTSVEIGQRDSFLKFFAEDGIRFAPEPVNARASLLKTPPEPTPRPRTLDWEPLFVLAARSGDLGLSTGPVEVRDNTATPPRVIGRAWYFSMWRLQPDHTWRVAADLGITDSTAPPLRTKPLQVAGLPGVEVRAVEPGGTGARDALLQFDEQVARLAEKQGLMATYLPLLDAESRLLREGHAPAVGPAAIQALLTAVPTGVEQRRPTFSAVSRAGDLGYTYGTYRAAAPAAGGQAREGSYVRVWKRKSPSEWVLAAEVVTTR